MDKLALSVRKTIEEIAMDVGKEVALHIEIMYPEAVAAASSSFLLSVRNTTFNQIMLVLTSDRDVAATLKVREKSRRQTRAVYKAVRKNNGIGSKQ